MTRRPTALLPLLCFAACSRGGELSANASSADPASAFGEGSANTAVAGAASRSTLDSAAVRSAEEALSRWLSAAREVEAGAQLSLASDPACDDGGGAWFPSTLLADFTLLPSETRGDTVVGRAEVITVAEQDLDRQARDRFVARQRIQRAVLEWDVIPVDDGSWAVCNGLRFGYRGSDSLTTWRPDGSSYQTARLLADSVMTARRLADSVVAARQAALSSSSPP